MAIVFNGRSLLRPITGVERYAHALLPLLAAERPDTRIAVPVDAPPFDAHGLEVVRTGHARGHRWEQVQLPRAVGRDDLLLSPANTGPLRVRQQALVLHDLAFLDAPAGFAPAMRWWYRALVPRLVERCATVITPSAPVREAIIARFSVAEQHVHVVPPYARASMPAPNRRPQPRPYLLLIGAFDPRKRATDIAHAYTQLAEPAFDLVLVGRRTPSFRIPDIPAHHGIKVLDDVDDEQLAALLTDALALVHASLHEGFGLPVLEACALGCPVIAQDTPLMRTLFGDGILLTDRIGANELPIAVELLMRTEERSAMIARGHTLAATFTKERTAEALRQALEPLLT